MNRILRGPEILLLLGAILFFQTLSSALFLAGFYFDLALVLVIYVSRYLDAAQAVVIGCLFGLAQDVTGLQPLWGLNGFTKTALALLGFLLIRRLVFEDFWSKSLLVLVLSILDSLMILLLMTLLTSDIPSGFPAHAASRAVATALLGGVLLSLLDNIKFPDKDFRQFE